MRWDRAERPPGRSLCSGWPSTIALEAYAADRDGGSFLHGDIDVIPDRKRIDSRSAKARRNTRSGTAAVGNRLNVRRLCNGTVDYRD
jgi:hypothetical protein